MITITLNNNPKEILVNTNIPQLLKQFNIDQDGIAVAINNQIITKSVWGQTPLQQNDNILIIKATQGG